MCDDRLRVGKSELTICISIKRNGDLPVDLLQTTVLNILVIS